MSHSVRSRLRKRLGFIVSQFSLFFVVATGSLAQSLEEGVYTGFIEKPGSAGQFDLVAGEDGSLRGSFRTTVDVWGSTKAWDLSVKIRPDPEADFAIEIEGSGWNVAEDVLLYRFDTAHGPAFIGTYTYLLNDRNWTGELGIWLDPTLDPSVYGRPRPAAPELKVDDRGRYRIWTAEPGGLANNATRCILKSSDGYLWVGTVDGLNRFDGKSWINYFSETAPSLPGWNFRGIAEDRDGNLVVLIKDHGLFRFKDGEWTPFECNTQLEGHHLSGLQSDNSGRLWTSMDTTHLLSVDENEQLTSREVAKLLPLWRPDDFHGVGVGGAVPYLGGLLVPTVRGPFYSGLGVGGFPFWIPRRVGDLSYVGPGLTGDLWVASLSHIYHYDEYGRVAESYHPRSVTGTLRMAFPRRNGGLWVIGGKGLFLMPNPEEIIQYSALPQSVTESPANAIEDEEGNIWIAMSGGGLCQFQPGFIESVDIDRIVSVDGRGTPRPVSLATDDAGDVMMALDLGAARANRAGDYQTHFSGDYHYETVAAESGGPHSAWWSGVLPTNPLKVNVERGSVKPPLPVAFRYANNEIEPYCIPSKPLGLSELSSMLWVEGSGAWLGSRDGVWICAEGEVQSWNDSLGLPRFDVSSLLEGGDGSVWVATEGAGLYRWTSAGNRVEHSSEETGEIASNNIFSIAESRIGGLWIADAEGIYWCSLDEESKPVDIRGELSLPVHSVLEDRSGNLWAGTSTGIYCLRADEIHKVKSGPNPELNWLRFARPDGLSTPSVESGQFPLAVNAAGGQMYFCMQGDLVSFDPEELLNSVSEGPRVRLTHLSNGEKMLWLNEREQQQSPFLRLEPGSGSRLEVGFAATHFSDPELVKFRYRIGGSTQSWNDLGAQQSVWLFDLAPGDYTFEVEAIDKNWVKSPGEAVLRFQILPHFYQTLAFKIGGLVLVLGFLWGLHHRRVRNRLRLQSVNNQLRLEADRRRIAHDMHDEIGASFAQLKILGELVESRRVEGPALDDSVSRIVTLAKAGSQTLREILWALEPSQLEGEDLAEFLGETLENLFDGSGIQLCYKHSWSESNAELSLRFKREVILIAKGVVSNVIRHSRAQNFRCELHGEGPVLRLRFVDDGIGFDPPNLPGDTLGMESLRQRVERWGGVFEPKTQPGKGVTIELSLDSRCDTVGRDLVDRSSVQ